MNGERYKTLTVSYLLNEAEYEALTALNQKFRDYTAPDGSQPFKEQTEERLFDFVMCTGAGLDKARKIGFAMMKMGMISVDEWMRRSEIPIEKWNDETENKETDDDQKEGKQNDSSKGHEDGLYAADRG